MGLDDTHNQARFVRNEEMELLSFYHVYIISLSRFKNESITTFD